MSFLKKLTTAVSDAATATKDAIAHAPDITVREVLGTGSKVAAGVIKYGIRGALVTGTVASRVTLATFKETLELEKQRQAKMAEEAISKEPVTDADFTVTNPEDQAS